LRSWCDCSDCILQIANCRVSVAQFAICNLQFEIRSETMCDTWIALSGATSTKQIIFGKNSDRPIFDCQPLMHYPRKEWARESRIQLAYIELPQVETTYAPLGSSPYWCWGYEEGISESGVVIG